VKILETTKYLGVFFEKIHQKRILRRFFFAFRAFIRNFAHH